MKLALGAAQIGQAYGITNANGSVEGETLSGILAFARDVGIDLIDTAAAYGNSEALLGAEDLRGFRIVSKISTPDQIKHSLRTLKQSMLYGLLLHSPEALGKQSWKALKAAKDSGKVQKIGVSVYTAAQIDDALSQGGIDIVQIPINLFDQRLMVSGHLARLKDAGIEIHARSLFLQGVLLEPLSALPPYFRPFKDAFTRYEAFLIAHNISRIKAALAFAHRISEIDYALVGVTSLPQLREIIEATDTMRGKAYDFTTLSVTDEALINPTRWPRS